ncbi:MAG: UDP-2,4-diacetamido-2,4,6-trideoxy-beta-L-altropyranose hydrolase [Nitrosopumilaceae archaeon]
MKIEDSSYSKKVILFRCITDSYYGLGHFQRCIVLANELKKMGYLTKFIITHNEFIEKELRSSKIPYIKIPNYNSITKESKNIFSIMNSNRYKIIVVDMREFSEKLCKNLFYKKIKTILIDDAWTKNAYADLIFNGTLIKQYQKYKKKNKNCKIFVGPQYNLIKEEFKIFRKKTKKITTKSSYVVVITTGGTDPNEVSLIVIKSILMVPNLKIIVIVGPFSKNLKKIQEIAKGQRNIKILESPKNIWKIFNLADLVISSAGNTLYELSIQHVPTICIAAEEHQIPYGRLFSGYGFSIFLGLWKNINEKQIQTTLTKLLTDVNLRKKISKPNKKILDENGTKKISLEISKFIKILENY